MEEWVISTKYVWIGLEEGKIPIIMYNLEMFMTTRKIRRVNNASKIFTSSVEEGDISNTISYVKLFMITMKMKTNLCNEHQYEMWKSWNGGWNNAFKIFTGRVEEETLYEKKNSVWNCS